MLALVRAKASAGSSFYFLVSLEKETHSPVNKQSHKQRQAVYDAKQLADLAVLFMGYCASEIQF